MLFVWLLLAWILVILCLVIAYVALWRNRGAGIENPFTRAVAEGKRKQEQRKRRPEGAGRNYTRPTTAPDTHPFEPVEQALAACVHALDEFGAPYAVIGGVAAGLLTQPRATRDVDVSLWLNVRVLAGALAPGR